MIRAASYLAIVILALAGGAKAASAQPSQLLEAAISDAVDRFEQALPSLGPMEFGVDVTAYRDALTLQRFSSGVWGGDIAVAVQVQDEATSSCDRFAAFARVPPQNGVVPLVVCPRFFTPGADELRELTILHEMVHVVAGTNECQAMAFAARVQHAATGRFTPVDGYWRASGCESSQYRLP